MKTKIESTTTQVVKNSFWNFLMIFLTRVGGLIFVAIIARILLPEKYGIYALATSITLLILAFTNRGTNQTLVKYLSEALGKNKKKQAASYYKFIFKLKLLLTLVSSIILFLLAYPLTFFIFRKPDLFIPLIISSVYLFCFAFQNFYEYAFYAIKKVRYLTIKEIIHQVSRIVLVLIFFTLLSKKYHLPLTILTLVLASLITILFLFFYLKKETPFIFKKSEEKIDKKRTIKFFKNLIFSNFSGILFSYIDIVVIGILLTSVSLGYYSAALAIVGGLYGFVSIANLLLPVFTQMKKEKLTEAFNKVFRYSSMVSIPLIFGSIILGKYVLRAVYGYDYVLAVYPLIFLSFLIFEFPMTDALKSLFYAREKPEYVVKISLIALFFNIILNFSLAYILLNLVNEIWAVSGVAIATSISRLFILTFLTISARKKLDVKYSLKFIIKPIIAGAIMMFALLTINNCLTNLTLLMGIFEIILGAFIYVIIMLLLKGINKQDLALIKILISKKN